MVDALLQFCIQRRWVVLAMLLSLHAALVVDPEDVSVLDPTAERTLTLVTCYPFYFVGSAPQRFIVRAVRVGVTPVSPSSQVSRTPIG